jgi:hypothetical protein
MPNKVVVAFIFAAMTFFLYVWSRILFSKNTTMFEKFYSTLAVAMLEFYYVMQLFEHL